GQSLHLARGAGRTGPHLRAGRGSSRPGPDRGPQPGVVAKQIRGRSGNRRSFGQDRRNGPAGGGGDAGRFQFSFIRSPALGAGAPGSDGSGPVLGTRLDAVPGGETAARSDPSTGAERTSVADLADHFHGSI